MNKLTTTWFASGGLPFEMAHAAIKNYHNASSWSQRHVRTGNLKEALLHGFHWMDTPEGRSFWSEVKDYIEYVENGWNIHECPSFRPEYYEVDSEMREKLEDWILELIDIHENKNGNK